MDNFYEYRPAMITQMRVKGLIFDPYNNAYIVVLRDEDNSDMLPIWVGKSEASAIGLALESVTAPRPMTRRKRRPGRCRARRAAAPPAARSR